MIPGVLRGTRRRAGQAVLRPLDASIDTRPAPSSVHLRPAGRQELEPVGRGEAGASGLDLPTRMKGAIDIPDVAALTEDLPERGLYRGHRVLMLK